MQRTCYNSRNGVAVRLTLDPLFQTLAAAFGQSLADPIRMKLFDVAGELPGHIFFIFEAAVIGKVAQKRPDIGSTQYVERDI